MTVQQKSVVKTCLVFKAGLVFHNTVVIPIHPVRVLEHRLLMEEEAISAKVVGEVSALRERFQIRAA